MIFLSESKNFAILVRTTRTTACLYRIEVHNVLKYQALSDRAKLNLILL